MAKRLSCSNSTRGDNQKNGKSSTQPKALDRRVKRSRRKMIQSELIISTTLAPNELHPLSDLDHLAREKRRVTTIASVLADIAKRKADEEVNRIGGEE